MAQALKHLPQQLSEQKLYEMTKKGVPRADAVSALDVADNDGEVHAQHYEDGLRHPFICAPCITESGLQAEQAAGAAARGLSCFVDV